MSDNATREDVEKAKKEIIDRIVAMDNSVSQGIEGHRQQQSAEHGTILAKLLHNNELLHWIRSRWERFTRDPTAGPAPKEKDK
jgi:hypothetical protein